MQGNGRVKNLRRQGFIMTTHNTPDGKAFVVIVLVIIGLILVALGFVIGKVVKI